MLEPETIYIHRPLGEFVPVKLYGKTSITNNDEYYHLEFSAMVEVLGDFERDKFIIEVIALALNESCNHILHTIKGYHANFHGHIKITGKLHTDTIFITNSRIEV